MNHEARLSAHESGGGGTGNHKGNNLLEDLVLIWRLHSEDGYGFSDLWALQNGWHILPDDSIPRIDCVKF